MKVKTMKLALTKQQANLLWNLLYYARDDVIRKYGDSDLSNDLRALMDKCIYPDESKVAK